VTREKIEGKWNKEMEKRNLLDGIEMLIMKRLKR